MMRIRPLSLIVTCLLGLWMLMPERTVAQGNGSEHAETVPGEILLRPHSYADLKQVVKELNENFQGIEARIAKEVSKPLDIWLIRFEDRFPHAEILGFVAMHPGVSVAQSNHVIRNRATLPNDPNIALQWQYVNSGANNGVVDADIDADLAWDITTGGLTPFGDTIVACIIDDGLDLTHPDFGGNRWYNFQEIPNNGIDDDGNGYLDDFEGWDAYNSVDNISGGGHGTPVAGIVGAKGNNGTGVSGVNWNVKLMIVEGGGNEAEAIAAYTYPLVMRKLWNQTNGAKGAYVVVTNASWGTNFGQPSQAPLWCAIYDSLGKHGVLSCGATANLNVNVDTQGDLPTACPSEYLISVTNTNNRDEKIINAGYGAVSIDIGAPGENAYTVAAGGNYAAFGGTSGATPHVSGAVALLYSVACPNLAALALSHPDSAARLVKQMVLDGADPNLSLQGISVAEGRLNLHGAIQLLTGWGCNINGCYQAFGLATQSLSDTSAWLTWNALPAADSFVVQVRELGNGSWQDIPTNTDSLWIDTLQACKAYEFRVGAVCDTVPAVFSSIHTFTTDGCCTAPSGLDVSSITASSAEISFDAVLAAQSYNLRYAVSPGGTWVTQNAVSNPFLITGLDSCTSYEVQIQTVCDTGATLFSASTFFRTTGCLGCEQTYCSLSGANASEEWIANVMLGTINNTTGSDNGYGDFTGQFSAQLAQTGTYDIFLTPGFSGAAYSERFNVFIDYNQDGDFFDALENAYSAPSTTQTMIQGSFSVPAGSLLGVTRMRVVMRFSQNNPGCGPAFDYGEVEDYCVEILDASMSTDWVNDESIRVFPNPTPGKFNFSVKDLGDEPGMLYLVDIVGHVLQAWEIEHPEMQEIDVTEIPGGLYVLRYGNSAGTWSSRLMILK